MQEAPESVVITRGRSHTNHLYSCDLQRETTRELSCMLAEHIALYV